MVAGLHSTTAVGVRISERSPVRVLVDCWRCHTAGTPLLTPARTRRFGSDGFGWAVSGLGVTSTAFRSPMLGFWFPRGAHPVAGVGGHSNRQFRAIGHRRGHNLRADGWWTVGINVTLFHTQTALTRRNASRSHLAGPQVLRTRRNPADTETPERKAFWGRCIPVLQDGVLAPAFKIIVRKTVSTVHVIRITSPSELNTAPTKRRLFRCLKLSSQSRNTSRCRLPRW